MSNKTIMDAVNELRGVWTYKGSVSAYFRPAILCDTGYWYYEEPKHFNDEHVCNLKAFNSQVRQCSSNFGTSCSYEEYKHNLASKHKRKAK